MDSHGWDACVDDGHRVASGKKKEGVDKLMTSRHLCAIRLHERKTAMP